MSDWSSLLNQLETCVGSEALRRGADGLPIDEIPLRAVCSPATVRELCEVVRIASAANCPIYPLGGQTQLGLGLPGRAEGIGVSTTRLDRVIDYPSRDMTITVDAGIRIAKLQEVLRAEGQRLPVDVPRAAEATLGGAIATNTSGPRRYGLGTFRDYVIGISVVDAAGNETKAGGRVVKNVAGYDMCKLYTGSLGTLGIITQVTLKLKPIPEASSLVALKFKDLAPAAAALDRVSCSRTRPVAIELLNPAASEFVAGEIGADLLTPTNYSLPWILIIGFEENAEAVHWQEDQLIQETAEFIPWSAGFANEQARSFWSLLVEFQSLELGQVTFKANLRGSRMAEFLSAASREAVAWAVQAHAGTGVAYGHAPHCADQAALRASLANLRSLVVSLGGNLVLRRCPTDWKGDVPVWGEPRSDLWLMRAIKHKLDPKGILNPGRFVD